MMERDSTNHTPTLDIEPNKVAGTFAPATTPHIYIIVFATRVYYSVTLLFLATRTAAAATPL